jgi:hypothetical protein
MKCLITTTSQIIWRIIYRKLERENWQAVPLINTFDVGPLTKTKEWRSLLDFERSIKVLSTKDQYEIIMAHVRDQRRAADKRAWSRK